MHASTTTAASAAIRSGPGALVAVLLTAGSDAASATIYDNTAGSGTVLAVLQAAANSTVSWTPPGGQAAAHGLYAALTGTAPSVTVVYQ
jgi:hypothetical protein